MSFEITDFLAGLFGDRPAKPAAYPSGDPAADAPEPEPQAGDAGDAAGEPTGGLDFSGWVRRPDCRGRMGWEPPDLPEAARWWARWDFDELPELVLPDNLGRPAKPTAQDGPDCEETRPANLKTRQTQPALTGASVGFSKVRTWASMIGKRWQETAARKKVDTAC